MFGLSCPATTSGHHADPLAGVAQWSERAGGLSTDAAVVAGSSPAPGTTSTNTTYFGAAPPTTWAVSDPGGPRPFRSDFERDMARRTLPGAR